MHGFLIFLGGKNGKKMWKTLDEKRFKSGGSGDQFRCVEKQVVKFPVVDGQD